MPKESLGFIKLEWTCQKCGRRNPGPEKTCLSCGAPQPESVAFEAPANQELVKDQKELEKAKAGSDIHCGFCGTRNPAGSKVCSQCGADLTHGTHRESGKVVGSFSTAPAKQIECPNCGTKNPETAHQCAQCGANLRRDPSEGNATAASIVGVSKTRAFPVTLLAVVIGIVCLGVFASVLFMSLKTEGVTGVVENVNWTTRVMLQELQPVEYSGWLDEIPAEAEVGDCTMRVQHTQEEPAPNSNKVCGTPYTVDKGSGFAEVVQDCVYEVMQDYCSYTSIEWRQIDSVELSGKDKSPVWANPQLAEGQRLGEREQTYTIVFATPDGVITYTTNDTVLFEQIQPGSEWVLNINSFGNIISIEPTE